VSELIVEVDPNLKHAGRFLLTANYSVEKRQHRFVENGRSERDGFFLPVSSFYSEQFLDKPLWKSQTF
jgi:hypothetical protein